MLTPLASRVTLLAPLFLLPVSAHATGGGSAQFLPAGLVFPEFTHGIEIDPAALVWSPASAFQLEVSPGAVQSSSSSNFYDGTYTYATSAWALGMGYNGAQSPSSNTLTHAIVAGAAARISSFSLGLSMESPIITRSFSPSYAASFQIAAGSSLQFAAILEGLFDSIDRMGLGLGQRKPGHYTIEGGVKAPFFTEFFDAGARHEAYLGGAYFMGSFGISGGVSAELTNLDSPAWSVGALWEAGQKLRLTAIWNEGGYLGLGQSNPQARGRLTIGLAFAL